MKPQTILVSVLALVFGGSAALGVRQFMGLRPAAAKVPTVPLVVAVADIPAGTMVTAERITVRPFPKDSVPEGAIGKVEDCLDRAAYSTIVKGETLLGIKLGPKGEYGLAAKIPKGMRAFTINTPDVAAGVAGFIHPGNLVDVLMTVTSGGNDDATGGGSTTTLLQRVEILAVDHRMESVAESTTADGKQAPLRSVTLLVTPDQAAKLDLGQSKGELHLSLRHPEDDDTAGTLPATMRDIRFHQEAPARPWDERAKGFLSAVGATLAQARPERGTREESKPETPVVQAPQFEKRVIRTIRGSTEGAIQVLKPTSASLR